MIAEMSFKCLLDVFCHYCQETYLETQSKVYEAILVINYLCKKAPS